MMAGAGCALEPASMDEVAFPPGFVFDAHRDVHVRVVGEAAPGAYLIASVPGEGVRFEGAVSVVAEHGLALRVAPHVEALDLIVRIGEVRHGVSAPIDGDGEALVDLDALR